MKANSTDYRNDKNPQEAKSQKSIVNFFFELGMLNKTPRSGFQFLGSGRQSVADHSYRVAMIGYTLTNLVQYHDPFRVVCLCLFHDVSEARTGDLNYVNKQYVQVDESSAIQDLTNSLPFGAELEALFVEYRNGQTMAAKLAHDADQLDLILELKEQQDLGNSYASQWIPFALKRLQTEIGQKLAAEILETDSSSWWFEGNDRWWHSNQES